MVFIQEPYIIHSRVVGITKRYRTFTSTIGRSRTATVITNNQIDALLIREATDKDTVVIEITLENLKFYMVNMYLDITEKLDKTIEQINDILQLANTRGLLITMDSNSRSRTWHDKLTNGRGKRLEELLISKQLFIMNEDSEMTTFQSTRGSSYIDLTISNYKLLKEVQEWKIIEEESCSDHKIIQFYIGQYNAQQAGSEFQSIKYVVREENQRKFETLITQEMAKQMCGSRRGEDSRILDKCISLQIAYKEDMEDIVRKFSDALTAACDKSFKKAGTHMKTQTQNGADLL